MDRHRGERNLRNRQEDDGEAENAAGRAHVHVLQPPGVRRWEAGHIGVVSEIEPDREVLGEGDGLLVFERERERAEV